MKRLRVVVVGGGTVGLAIAEQLSRRGVRTVVVDRQALAGEASWAASGFLDLREASGRGEAFFTLCLRSCEMFAEWTAALWRDGGVDPEYVRSQSLDLVFDAADARAAEELASRLARHGIGGEWLSGEEALRREPELAPDVRGALFLPHPAQVRPPRLNRALIAALGGLGAELLPHAEVAGFRCSGREVRAVETAGGTIEADQVVLACGPWSAEVAARLGVTLAVRPVRGQALLLRGSAGRLRHILFGLDGYVVARRDGRIYVGSTIEETGFVKATTPRGLAKLGRIATRMVPELADLPVEGSWSGLRPATADGLPYMGPAPGFDNLWIAAGHFTHGIVLSAATGRLMAQAILGERPDQTLAPFAPGRPATVAPPAAGGGAPGRPRD